MRDIIKPTFKHEISSAMQIKDKKAGSLSGNYELVWDALSDKYVMRSIDDGQVSLFDDNEEKIIQMPQRTDEEHADDDDYSYEEPDEGDKDHE